MSNPANNTAPAANSPTLVFAGAQGRYETWKQVMATAMPELNVVWHGQVDHPEQVQYALLWKPDDGFFEQYPNLKMLINQGAGVDALLSCKDLPELPITRLVDPNMSQMMAGFVLFAVMRYARHIHLHEQFQSQGRWKYIHPKNPADVRVSILGMGELGTRAAGELTRQGFDVWGWSRTEKSVDGVTTRHGLDTLPEVLQRSDIVVLLMPLTPDTHHIVDGTRLDMLPKGACLINVARGQLIDEPALIERLQNGQIAQATLDVFETEPLPAESPLWGMDNVLITPHLASVPLPASAAEHIAANIRRVEQGLEPLHLIDKSRGY